MQNLFLQVFLLLVTQILGKIFMSRITNNTKLRSFNPTNLKLKKANRIQERNPKTSQILEKTPVKEYFDYSTEEKGYFTRRDTKGRVLEVISLIFPR